MDIVEAGQDLDGTLHLHQLGSGAQQPLVGRAKAGRNIEQGLDAGLQEGDQAAGVIAARVVVVPA